jgi:hypothetical protein
MPVKLDGHTDERKERASISESRAAIAAVTDGRL